MSQIKQFSARKDLALDCGHAIKADDTFYITKLYHCELEKEVMRAILKPFLHDLNKSLKTK